MHRFLPRYTRSSREERRVKRTNALLDTLPPGATVTRWKEKRAQKRHACRLPVRIDAGGEEHEGNSVNLSLGGMLIDTDRRFPLGTAVMLRFRLPALKLDTEVEATVRWSEEGKHGMQFGSLRARDVWALNKLFRTAREA
jgi:hypothetical protein